MEKKIARVFQEPNGLWHFCDDALDLDARGRGYRFVSDATAWAELEGFTHYKKNNNRIRKISCGKLDHTNVWGQPK